MKMLLKETAKILDGSFLIASDDGILPSSKDIENFVSFKVDR